MSGKEISEAKDPRVLVFLTGSFSMPCARECPFEQKCAQKFEDGTCKAKVENFIKSEIYGEPGSMEVIDEAINFKTTDPNGKVKIKNGAALVTR